MIETGFIEAPDSIGAAATTIYCPCLHQSVFICEK